MRGERRIKFPNACFSSTGKPLIHGPSSLWHHSFSPLSFPITPCCCTPPTPSPTPYPYVFYQATSVSPSYSLWLFPTPYSHPSAPSSSLLLYFHCLSFLYLVFLFHLFSCITGLWGRWLPVHHQGDNDPHGELQLPCLRLWRPLSDTCAAGEWSVVAHFLLTVEVVVCTKHFVFCLCYFVASPVMGIALLCLQWEPLKTVSDS